jgi:O-antigen/teichoic acid export membrane protein
LPPKKPETLAAGIAKYASSHIYRHVLSVFSAFIRTKLLTPQLMGLWNMLNIIPGYSMFLHLGANDCLRFMVPYHEARGQQDKAEQLIASTFYGSLIPNLVLGCGLFLYGLMSQSDTVTRAGIFTTSALVVFSWYYSFSITLLKARQNFSLITTTNYINSTMILLGSIILVFFFGLYGIYAAMLISYITVILFLEAKQPIRVRRGFDPVVFRAAIQTGLPIMLFSVITMVIRSLDRILVSWFLGLEQLGYYAISTMAAEFLMQIPGSAREVMEPRLMTEKASQTDEEMLRRHLFTPLLSSAYLMPFAIGPAAILLPTVVAFLLPRYTPGIAPAQIIVFGCYFLAFSFATRGIVVANHWQRQATVIMAGTVLVSAAISIGFIKLGFGLSGVALGSSISFLLLALGQVVFLRCRCNYAHRAWRRMAIGLCPPFMCTLALSVVLPLATAHLNVFLAAGVNLLIFFASTTALYFLAARWLPEIRGEA